jgi:hypothetical protein
MMKRIWIVVIFVAALVAMWIATMYIGLAISEEEVHKALAAVEKAENGSGREAGSLSGYGEQLSGNEEQLPGDGERLSGNEEVSIDEELPSAEYENYIALLEVHNASLEKFPARIFAPLFGFGTLEAEQSAGVPKNAK